MTQHMTPKLTWVRFLPEVGPEIRDQIDKEARLLKQIESLGESLAYLRTETEDRAREHWSASEIDWAKSQANSERDKP